LLTVPTAKTATATATAVTGPLESELDRACSAFWRGTAAQGGLALRQDVRARLGVLLSGVSAQVAGQVLVTGSSGRLPVQLENRLPYPVHVRVRLDSPGTTRIVPVSAEFTIPAAPAGSTTKSQQSLAITSRSAGRFPVQLQLQTTRGEVLGSVHPVEIRSQNYGPVAVGITAGALFVLVVALLVRALRALRRRSRRRAATTPA
jgi:hypothetical protein